MVIRKFIKNTYHMRGNLEPNWIDPYTIVEIKEHGRYIVKDKCSKIMKSMIHMEQVKLYFVETLIPGEEKERNVEDYVNLPASGQPPRGQGCSQ